MGILSLIAYSHYLGILILLGSLVYEWALWNEDINQKDIIKIGKADLIYGISSIWVLASGFIRIYNEKGIDYYFSNLLFLVKLGIFTVVGLLSIYPTIKFISWSRNAKKGVAIDLSKRDYNRILKIIRAEILLFLLIPLFAAMMARGLGSF